MANAQISTSVTIIDSLLGFQAISLTAFDTASVPTIAAGSKVEIAGGFFSFSSAESINATSWSAISTGDTAYITLTPSGTAGSQTLTAAWTSTAPEWSTSKQGYYTSAGSSVRVVGGCVKDGTSGSEYPSKYIYGKEQASPELKTKVIDIGDWNMVTTSYKSVYHGLDADKIRGVTVLIRQDSDLYKYGLDYLTDGQYWTVTGTQIFMSRDTGGNFDKPGYVSTSFNRGWITITYEA